MEMSVRQNYATMCLFFSNVRNFEEMRFLAENTVSLIFINTSHPLLFSVHFLLRLQQMTYKWLTINNRGFCELWPHDRLGLILAAHVLGCMTNKHIKKRMR